MNNLKTLIGYEYKKIFLRKSTWIIIVIAIFITLLSCLADTWGTVYVDGKPAYSHYEEMMTDAEYTRALSGRIIDDVLIGEMQSAYNRVQDVPLAGATDEFQTYARPYSSIYALVRGITNDVEAIDPTSFYELRREKMLALYQQANLSEVEIQKHLENDERVDKPLVFQHTSGYESIFGKFFTLGLSLTFLVSICLAPIFANENSDRTAQLILTSRYGKNKAILSKLITGISFTLISAVILLLLQCLPILYLRGFEGWDAPIQLALVTLSNPITLLEGVLILCALVIIASILIACIVMCLSAKLKNAFGVITIISIFTMICLFLNVADQYRFLSQLIDILPLRVTSENSIFTDYFYVVFNHCFTTYEIVPVIYGFLAILLLVFSYQSFKNQQIG